VASRNSKRSLLSAWITEHRPALIDPAVLEQIAAALAPISARYLRELVRECGVPLDPLVEGVRQESFQNLERTLSSLAALYASAHGASGRELQVSCRRLVIEAKEHARWPLKRQPQSAEAAARAAEKREMIEWMIVWLENPGIFPTWARLRMQAVQNADA
jgi:hypothetical protein